MGVVVRFIYLAFFLSIATLAISSLSIAKAELEQPNSEIRIGAVLGLSGAASYHSDAIRKGIELAVEDLEKAGIKVDVRFEDDQTNPAKTVSAFKFLIAKGYKYFIGPTWSFQAKAIEPVLRANNYFALLPAGSSLINGGASEVFFNLCPRRDKQLAPLKNWIANQKDLRAVILTPNGDWGQVHNDIFSKAVSESGATLIDSQSFDYGTDLSTIKSILLRKQTAGFNSIFITGSPADVANIVRAKNQLGIKSSILATHDIVDAVELGLLSSEELGKDLYVSRLQYPGEDFQRKFEAKYSETAKLYSDRAYDALIALATAISKTDATPANVKNYLRREFSSKGTLGMIEFDANGDLAQGEYQLVAYDQ